ncbi:hypothetical protein I79_021559 [Cricetulus griseus]|uniref:Uncharacterized protein n=1 Tax=Cricetulus griseus TaxID=10029 RepID=G3ICZ8_CRIGR|nr:hypothetical protein I79_021559 [Cricetulus griseus]
MATPRPEDSIPSQSSSSWSPTISPSTPIPLYPLGLEGGDIDVFLEAEQLLILHI